MKKLFQENPIRITLAFLCILSFIGLSAWKYYAPLHIHEWNKKEISRIKVADPVNFSFAVFGDNKGNRSIFQPLLRDISHDKEIAFAIDVGDLVRKGKRGLFRNFLSQLQRTMTIPFLTAVGNHDLDNGSGNYQEIFGPTYYSFQIGQNYFIVLDASTEPSFDKTQLKWLEDELGKAQSSKARFVFMHIPPFDPRSSGAQPDKDRKDLLDLFRRYNVTHLFASHIHGYFSGFWEGIPYTITGGAGGRLQGSDPQHFFHHYVKVHVHDGNLDTMVRRIEAKNAVATIYDLVQDDLFELGLLVGAGIFLITLGLPIRRNRASRPHHLGS